MAAGINKSTGSELLEDIVKIKQKD